MKAERILAVFCAVTLLTLILAGPAGAEAPRKINYQGRLTDSGTGEPIAGPLVITFRIFDVEENGSAAWTETQAVTADSAGVISWLEVEVGGEILSPRREMASVPYAFHAMNAVHASSADSLGGVEADSFSVEGHIHDDRYFTESELSDPGTVNDIANPVDWGKLKNVPAGFADGTDDAGGAGDGYSLDAADGDPLDVVYVDNSGQVGVGTTTPERRLHVYDGSAGSATASSEAEVVIEDDNDARINLLTPGDKTGGIEFGDPVDPSSGWLVYNNTDDRLKLGVNNADRLVIDNSGEVGIGTGGPSAQLHAYKNTNGPAEIKIENPNTGSNSTERLSFVNEDGNVAYISAYDEGSGSYSDALVMANNRPNGNLKFYTGSEERLSISNYGATYVTAPGGSPLMCTTTAPGYIEIHTDNTAPVGLMMQNNHRSWYVMNGPGFADRLSFYDAGVPAERLVILGGSGYVGIHKTNPNRELDISGRLKAWHDEAGMTWAGEFYGDNAGGHGLMAVGNDGPYWYVTGGTGINSSGYDIGGYFRAVKSSSNGGQKAIFAQNGAGGYTYICYR
ncbi:MAG: hypothetical protein PVH52_05365, partial [bacterium]